MLLVDDAKDSRCAFVHVIFGFSVFGRHLIISNVTELMRVLLQVFQSVVYAHLRWGRVLYFEEINKTVDLTLATCAMTLYGGIGPQDLLKGHLRVVHGHDEHKGKHKQK